MIGEFMEHVPKEAVANAEFRKQMVRLGQGSRASARELWSMCRSDMLFWCNTFVFTYDPRRKIKAIPMVTWPFQDTTFASLERAIVEQHDVVIDKSRDMGASWMILLAVMHRWLFFEHESFLLMSRKEDLVDASGDMDALIPKLDWVLRYSPPWMCPSIDRKLLTLHNLDNGSKIDGESTTGDAGRGGRRTAMLIDEFASVADDRKVMASTASTTDCRLFNSTPKGQHTQHYKLTKSPDIELIRLHWSVHPIKNIGLTLDENGKPSSPWYEKEKKRYTSSVEIAQELDIDHVGAGAMFYSATQIDELMKNCVPPDSVWQFSTDDDGENPQLKPFREGITATEVSGAGLLSLWCKLDTSMRPPMGDYGMGVDISNGTGSSNSVCSIFDAATGKKVASYVSNRVRPEQFSAVVLALGRMFGSRGKSFGPADPNDRGEAYCVPESNGPGIAFCERLWELGYRNVMRRTPKTQDVSKGRRIGGATKIGWHATAPLVLKVSTDYADALYTGQCTNLDADALSECTEIVYTKTGNIVHASSLAADDPSGASDQHADRVRADSLGWLAIRDRTRSAMAKRKDELKRVNPRFAHAVPGYTPRAKLAPTDRGWDD